MNASTPPPSLAWQGELNGYLELLDQTRLPGEVVALPCCDVAAVFEAIRSLRVRGAPAIGIAAAYGVVVAAQEAKAKWGDSPDRQVALREAIVAGIDRLAESRPTAVNLFWALERMRRRLQYIPPAASVDEIISTLLAEARAIHEEDRQMCHAMGRYGAELLAADLAEGGSVLTHCNTGGLATAEYGTALSAIFTAHDRGAPIHVFVDETRPLLQGARLTAWELAQHGVPATLICDSMAAQVMREGGVKAVITGADRIAANGDAANKIGTYSLAVLAAYHGIPFYVAAPSSTFDLSLAAGDAIPIEQRAPQEITHVGGVRLAAEGVDVYNPAFDVTPAKLIAALVTERGVIRPVNRETIAAMLK